MTVEQAKRRLSKARRAVGIAQAAADQEVRLQSPYIVIAQREVRFRQRFVDRALDMLEDARREEQRLANEAAVREAQTIGGYLAARHRLFRPAR